MPAENASASLASLQTRHDNTPLIYRLTCVLAGTQPPWGPSLNVCSWSSLLQVQLMRNQGCPDAQGIANQAHWNTLMLTLPSVKQYICRASCRVTGAAQGVLTPRADLYLLSECLFSFSISCASAAPRGPCPVELMYHNGLRP